MTELSSRRNTRVAASAHNVSAIPASDTNFRAYQRLYADAELIWITTQDSHRRKLLMRDLVGRILRTRTAGNGLDPNEFARLLVLLRNQPENNLRRLVIEEARKLRETCFGKAYSCMVPLELSSFCSSECSFCGWRARNRRLPQYTISKSALAEQVASLAKMGFTHFELASGDDLPFLKENLGEYVRIAKQVSAGIDPRCRVSICTTPLTEHSYKELANLGLDAVITWQETYSEELFYKYVLQGPKAHGITKDFALVRKRQGYLFRLQSIENALRSGLQVGIGTMLGLNIKVEAEMLSLILHAKLLLHSFPNALPLILGMPIWNATTIPGTDSRPVEIGLNAEKDFEFIAALYLLALPNRSAWVFPNCRVSLRTQIATVVSSGVFTSTSVQLVPGGYLDRKAVDGAFVRKSQNAELAIGEQFRHHYHDHRHYQDAFKKHGLNQVADKDLL
ncbi:MAG: radical SAM protein [Elusimicrobiota bacterium]